MSLTSSIGQPRALVASVGVLAVSPLPLMLFGPKPTRQQAPAPPTQQQEPQKGPQPPPGALGPAAGKQRAHKHHGPHRHHRRRTRRARLTRGGHAIAPAGAPTAVKRLIRAANRIARTPYVWGGGHGGWRASGYDCSGSLSYALHGAGLLRHPRTSGALMGYGRGGRGHWITIYANGGHTYMVVAGLRFDTSSHGPRNSRWTGQMRSAAGYVARHPGRL